LLRILTFETPQIAISCGVRGGQVAPMTFDMLTALILFAFASSITPGPNNVMLLASGANFGLRRTVPHMLGISGGHAFMVALVGLGLLGLFAAVPWLRRR
jgi:threonine/homoserine/homoserine lactone efflux protein